MADEKRQHEKEETSEQPSRGGRLKPIIIIAVLMLVEGVGIFVLMKLISPTPQPAVAAENEHESPDDPLMLGEHVEVALCEISAFNRKEGRLYVYNAQISALVAAKDREKVDRFIAARELSIKDRVQLVFRSADPQDLNDPGLETIKRQLRFELNNLLGGKEMVQEVLIPKLLQSRANL